jgi:hypothetical protein
MVPTKEDFDGYVNKAKSVGQDSLKEIETQSKKMLDRVEQARREGKSQADAFISGLKDGQSIPLHIWEGADNQLPQQMSTPSSTSSRRLPRRLVYLPTPPSLGCETRPSLVKSMPRTS